MQNKIRLSFVLCTYVAYSLGLLLYLQHSSSQNLVLSICSGFMWHLYAGAQLVRTILLDSGMVCFESIVLFFFHMVLWIFGGFIASHFAVRKKVSWLYIGMIVIAYVLCCGINFVLHCLYSL
jgi:hypothetical protein